MIFSICPIFICLPLLTDSYSATTLDIYCYICNDSKLDPELALHLSTFGINVQTQTKTEKSMTELQIEHNLKFDFSLTDESGKALEPVFGPGLTGLANLGNRSAALPPFFHSRTRICADNAIVHAANQLLHGLSPPSNLLTPVLPSPLPPHRP